MNRNSDETSHLICTVSVEREEYRIAIEDIVHQFLGEHVTISQYQSSTGAHEYWVWLHLSEALEPEEFQKLHNLCWLRCNSLSQMLETKGKAVARPSNKADGDDATSKVVTKPDVSSDSPPKDRFDTLRIKNIPASHTREIIEVMVQNEFLSKPRIHSLCKHLKDFCATITFPEEDHGFPTKQLPIVLEARQLRLDAPVFQYDDDFLGLTTFYNPAPDLPVDADIVAVVGLGTHAFGTFRSSTPGSHEMWLRDFLPQDIPNSRILLYGYPSTVTGGRSTEKIEDIAKTFLNRLTLHRKGTATRERPIIFIGQSLGGLIIQECLLRAADSTDQYEREIFTSWHGLVGFGIPIGGLNNSSLIEAVKEQPNKVLIEQLCLEDRRPSRYLIELKLRFERCCARKELTSYAPEVLYFWERFYSQPRTRNGKVGEMVLMVEDSATPGAKNLPLNSDHSGMVKYKSRTDLLYEDVSSNIKGMVDNLVELRDAHQGPVDRAHKGKGRRPAKGPLVPKRKGTFVSDDDLEGAFRRIP